MGTNSTTELPLPPIGRSFWVLAGLATIAVGLVAATHSGGASPRVDMAHDPALCTAVPAWRARFGTSDDLHVVATEVTFREKPKNFVTGEGIVVAPVALTLSGAEELLDVQADPPPLRSLKVGPITALAWEYAGELHRELRYRGFALVRRPTAHPYAQTGTPAFATLPHDLAIDAVLNASDIEEHGLNTCKDFVSWAHATAGAPPYTDQLRRLVQSLNQGVRAHEKSKEKTADDVCAAIREKNLTRHQASVAAVMGLRELGAPAYGFVGADAAHRYLAGTWVDGSGWLTMDVADPEAGFLAGGPGLVTVAPLIGHFEAMQDGAWSSAGAAYTDSQWGTSALSHTEIFARDTPSKDETVTQSIPLAEACR